MFNTRYLPVELICWTLGLIFLFFFGLTSHDHFRLCPLSMLGISWCPGCGLGRSVAAFLRGDISLSTKYHWFGIPALAIILHRLYSLFRKFRLSLILTQR